MSDPPHVRGRAARRMNPSSSLTSYISFSIRNKQRIAAQTASSSAIIRP